MMLSENDSIKIHGLHLTNVYTLSMYRPFELKIALLSIYVILDV